MRQIWITSDLHFGHNKDFIYKPRGFDSIEEHDKTIIENWNRLVQKEDIVYILGDLMLMDNDHGIGCIDQLNGDKIIILGNHDSQSRIELYYNIPSIVEIGYGLPMKYKGQPFYLSHYPTLTANEDEDKPLHRRVINLCGHSHTDNPFLDYNKGLIYHCELDAHNNEPILLDNILREIQKKEEK